ncbi:MAG: hypothetical protein ACI9EF_000576 [Pseudohongiellaceae bacterium]|jgi:hypothetical protein
MFGPFSYREGQLVIEDLALADLATDLAGQAAWVLSREALDAVFAGPARCLPLGLVGPLDVLTMAAAAGWWTSVVSSHELDLAEQAGFVPERIVASVGWHDDGFVKDALTRGIADLPAIDDTDGANIERIARLLGVERPSVGAMTRTAAGVAEEPTDAGRTSVPPSIGIEAFAQCGGLLAAVLRGGETYVLDTVLLADMTAAQTANPSLGNGAADVLQLIHCNTSKVLAREIAITGLTARVSAPHDKFVQPARLHGSTEGGEPQLNRGDSVLIPSLHAVACLPRDPAQCQPRHVMVHGALWRPLDQRPLPPVIND